MIYFQIMPTFDPLTFARSIVSRASFRRRSFLSLLLSENPATPPPPVLPPARCWKSISVKCLLVVVVNVMTSSYDHACALICARTSKQLSIAVHTSPARPSLYYEKISHNQQQWCSTLPRRCVYVHLWSATLAFQEQSGHFHTEASSREMVASWRSLNS